MSWYTSAAKPRYRLKQDGTYELISPVTPDVPVPPNVPVDETPSWVNNPQTNFEAGAGILWDNNIQRSELQGHIDRHNDVIHKYYKLNGVNAEDALISARRNFIESWAKYCPFTDKLSETQREEWYSNISSTAGTLGLDIIPIEQTPSESIRLWHEGDPIYGRPSMVDNKTGQRWAVAISPKKVNV